MDNFKSERKNEQKMGILKQNKNREINHRPDTSRLIIILKSFEEIRMCFIKLTFSKVHLSSTFYFTKYFMIYMNYFTVNSNEFYY